MKTKRNMRMWGTRGRRRAAGISRAKNLRSPGNGIMFGLWVVRTMTLLRAFLALALAFPYFLLPSSPFGLRMLDISASERVDHMMRVCRQRGDPAVGTQRTQCPYTD